MGALDGRVALITGAARGIGAAVAGRLAADGAVVAVLDLDEAAGKSTVAAIEAAGGRAIALGADVTNADQMTAAADRAAEELGPLDILVNNAGITRDNLLFKMPAQDWDSVIDVHLKAAFLLPGGAEAHGRGPHTARSSTSASSALGNRGQVNYAAAKAGVQGLTAHARDRARPVQHQRQRGGARLHRHRDDRRHRRPRRRHPRRPPEVAAEITPLRRVGQPEEIASVIAFLASETRPT